MTTTQVIELLRRRLLTVDNSAFFEDSDLLQAVDDARALLEAKMVSGMSGYVIDTTDTDDGISPNMTAQHALIVSLRAAADLLLQRYVSLTQSGALGVTWRSGLEEESTVSAEKAYRAAIDVLLKELDALILIQNRQTAGTRVT